MASDRADILRNAVAFLADPKTQESPIAQRIQFLEGKGLTSAEIDQAIREASIANPHRSQAASSTSNYGPGYSAYAPPSVYGLQPAPPLQRDWRDYFIMAVVSGTLMVGALALARKYLFPHLQPPSQTQYEADATALTAQFDAIEAKLKDMKLDCEEARAAAESQRDRVSNLVGEVEIGLKELKEGERKSRDELREIRDEVEVIREMLPKMLEKNKEGTNTSLGELQQELRSLKTLILNSSSRGFPSTTPSPGLPTLASRPSIPAWQLSMPTTSSSTPPPQEIRAADETPTE